MKSKKTFDALHVVLISITHMVHDIFSSFLAPILPLLIEKLAMTYTMAGFLVVAQRLPALLNPCIGVLADKNNLRYFVIAAPSVTTVSMCLLGVAPSYTVLVSLLLIMGLGSVMFHVPSPVMIRQLAGEQVGKGMSFYMLGGEIARTLGPLVILGAVSLWGLEGIWRLIPFGLLSSVILFFKMRNMEITNGNHGDPVLTSGIGKTLMEFLPLLATLAGMVFFQAFMKGALITFLPTYITVKGGSLWFGGISLVILQCAGAAGTLAAGILSDRIGRKKVLIIALSLSPLSMLLFTFASSFFVAPMLILLGLTVFALDPVILAIVNERKNDHPSFVNGTYMMISFFVAALTIVLTGQMADLLGLEMTYRIAAVIALLSIPCAARL